MIGIKVHESYDHCLAFLDSIGIGLMGDFVVEQMFEYFRLNILQQLVQVIRPLGNAPLEANLVVNFKTNLNTDLLESCFSRLFLRVFDVLGAFNYEFAEEEVE